MTGRPWKVLIVGMLLGAGLSALLFHLLAPADPEEEAHDASAGQAAADSPAPHLQLSRDCVCPGPASGGNESAVINQQLRREIGELKKELEAIKSGDPSDVLPGTFVGPHLFAKEPRDETWASEMEGLFRQKLDEHYGKQLGEIPVECRQKCCQIAVNEYKWRRIQPGFMMSGGLGLGGPGANMMSQDPGPDGTGYFLLCFDRKKDLENRPDRSAERQAILDAAQPSIEKCQAGLQTPLNLSLKMLVSPQGDVKSIDAQAEPLGHPAAPCVEKALLTVAEFGPIEHSRDLWVPFVIQLEPTPVR